MKDRKADPSFLRMTTRKKPPPNTHWERGQLFSLSICVRSSLELDRHRCRGRVVAVPGSARDAVIQHAMAIELTDLIEQSDEGSAGQVVACADADVVLGRA